MIVSLEALLALFIVLLSMAFYTVHVPQILFLLEYVHYQDSVTVAVETGTHVFGKCPVERYFLDVDGRLKPVCFRELR